MKEKLKSINALLEIIIELNDMIDMHNENKYLQDQFKNNKAGFVEELKKELEKLDIDI